MTKITDWHGCYDDGWKGMIVPESFAHPAKFSYSLICRIVRHGLDQGYWKPGDTIGDCFGGVATGGIVCGYHGLNWVGCELESRFVELGNKNLAMHGPRWMALESACNVKLLQGDSRRFAEVVGQVAGVVSSPPYAETQIQGGGANAYGAKKQADKTGVWPKGNLAKTAKAGQGYGDSSPGQIGSLKAGSLDGVISSPPYADSVHDGNGIDQSKLTGNKPGKNTQAKAEGYGTAAGQIGSLKSGSLDGVVTSPPWENQEPSHAQGSKFEAKHRELHPTKLAKNRPSIFQHEYGKSDGQIGESAGETYWQAMHAVYSSMREAMKPGAVAAIVVKDYVSKKARVPLCDQTCTLLESLGFEVFERCRCWLVKETREPSLFGGEHVTTTERKSFFRRLAEKKGSPRIDWEEVVWCRKSI